jgi:O-acetyl-ADP-ribose deacetylase
VAEILIEQGDLTEWQADAIVNAANNDLILGGGVAGAIARKGGPAIQQECRSLGPIKVGEAAITSGGRLTARYVIHAASMRLGDHTAAPSLEACVRASLALAEQHHLRSIAFPAIGTGIAGFPLDQCARIMIRVFTEHLQGPTSLEKIFVVLWDSSAYNIFQKALRQVGTPD